MSNKELGEYHQNFLAKYAKPNEHYSFEHAPVAILQNGEGIYASDEQLTKASTSWNHAISNAAAMYYGDLKPHHIDNLLENPTVRHMSKTVMLNNYGINQANLTNAWNHFKGGNHEGTTYVLHKILNHNKVGEDVVQEGINHPNPDISNKAIAIAHLRKWHHLLPQES